MTYFQNEMEAREVMGGFLLRFPGLSPVLKEAAGHEPMSLKLELTDPLLSAEIDMAAEPIKVEIGSDATGSVALSGPADNFHNLLIGQTNLAIAINKKQLIVRGPTSKLMKAAHMLFLAPYLYPYYLESIGRKDLIPTGPMVMLHGPREEVDQMTAIVSKLSYLIGYMLGLAKAKVSPGLDLVEILESLGKGLKSATPEK